MDGMSFGDWITLGAICVGWVGSFAAARSERVAFEVRLSTRFDALEERVRQLAGADTRLSVLEHQRDEDRRRMEALDRRLLQCEGNVHALASERGVHVRQATRTDPEG